MKTKSDVVSKWAEGAPLDLEIMEEQLRKELESREHQDPADFFGWHSLQTWVLEEAPGLIDGPVRIILACGGNRGGKSALAKGIWSETIRRKTPMSKQLMTADKYTGLPRKKGVEDNITCWVVPPTLEKARQDWLSPSDGYSLKYWAGDLFVKHEKVPDNVIYTAPPGTDIDTVRNNLESMADKTLMKSQDQKLETFESSAVDMCIFDEEIQSVAIWNSVLMRVATNSGFVVMAYTPLHGLTWSYERYWKPLVKMGKAHKVGDRKWVYNPKKGSNIIAVQFGCADNPLAKEYAEEIEHDSGMGDAERNARLHGEYGFVEGALVPLLAGLDVLVPDSEHDIYVVDQLPGSTDPGGKRISGHINNWLLVADPNKSYGAIMGGVDTDGNIFIVSEHLEVAWPDRLHARKFKEMANKHASIAGTRFLADPGSAGAHSMVNLADHGLMFDNVKKGAGSVGQGYKHLRSASWVDPLHRHPITGNMGAPRLYFYRPGCVSSWTDGRNQKHRSCRVADQLSQARQTDNPNAPPDTPHKSVRSKLDLVDCLRYLVSEVSVMSTGEVDMHPLAKRIDHDRLPDVSSGSNDYDIDPLDVEIWTPTYF